MAKATTGRIKTEDGIALFYRRWAGQANAPILLFVHGLGDHSGRYQYPVAFFVELGYTIYAYDQRGHGRSEGHRAYAHRFAHFIGDLDRVVRFIREKEGAKKIFIIGHSFGGQVVLTYAARHGQDRQISGIIASSPNLRLAMPVPYLKKQVGLLIACLLPKFPMDAGVNAAHLSHDPQVVKAYEEDPLVNKNITVRLASEMFANQDQSLRLAKQISIPCRLQHGTDDMVSDSAATEAFFDECASSDKSLKLYPGAYHELFNEVDKPEVFRDMQSWLESRSSF